MKKLYKIEQGKMLDGVCGGIAVFLGIDPTIVRLLWAALGLTGSGILLYFLASIIMPKESEVR